MILTDTDEYTKQLEFYHNISSLLARTSHNIQQNKKIIRYFGFQTCCYMTCNETFGVIGGYNALVSMVKHATSYVLTFISLSLRCIREKYPWLDYVLVDKK